MTILYFYQTNKNINLRTTTTITPDSATFFKYQLLNWAQQFREVMFLDSNADYNKEQKYSSYDCMLAVDAFTSIKTDYLNAFEDLKQYQQSINDWIFGYLSYDLKNDVENLKSNNFDGLNFPDLYFFQPKKLFLLKGNVVEILYLNMCDDEVDTDLKEILEISTTNTDSTTFKTTQQNAHSIKIEHRISKDDYLKKISKMLNHIQQGDIYEANFCMEFYAKDAEINPLEKFLKLSKISQAPFAVFFKNNNSYLLSASPERYLKKTNNSIISQPIKGTSKRFSDTNQDEKSKFDLQNDTKERAENIMIVDLVRNDLSKTAQKKSVQVEELCEIYTFSQVHQMISTITSQLLENYSAHDVLKTTFPMGSMTGAPKIAAMKIIDELEETKRGLYSGAVGYFMPNADFDFNVVIRSILYNHENNYLSFSVGSAITNVSIPQNEYQECLLKASAMFQILE